MRLRNKITGEEVGFSKVSIAIKKDLIKEYGTLADLNAAWEDVPEKEELKWFLGNSGIAHKETTNFYSDAREAIGNRFDTQEEAMEMVDKLKAWKRLRGRGFKFAFPPGVSGVLNKKFSIDIVATMPVRWFGSDEVQKDLVYLFGGEDD